MRFGLRQLSGPLTNLCRACRLPARAGGGGRDKQRGRNMDIELPVTLRRRLLFLIGYFHMGSKPALLSAAARISSHFEANASPSSFISIFDHASASTP